MSATRLSVLALCLALAACSSDRPITDGADGSPEWDRKLKGAVAIGTSVEDVVMLMQKNGFTCEGLDDTSSTLTCEKRSSGAGPRRWQATFEVKDGHVAAIQSATSIEH